MRKIDARPIRVLLTLAAVAACVIVLFMTLNAKGRWDFILAFRGTKVLSMVLVAYAVAVSTVLFQTVTNNRILTPEIMGFDRLFVLIQTAGVFVLGAATVTTADPRLRFAVEVVVLIGFGALLYRSMFGRTERDV